MLMMIGGAALVFAGVWAWGWAMAWGLVPWVGMSVPRPRLPDEMIKLLISGLPAFLGLVVGVLYWHAWLISMAS